MRFYEADVPEAVTAATWRRILDPSAPLFARLAEVGAGLAEVGEGTERSVRGFAVCVLHEGTWTSAPVCYLEDLFVAPAHRGLGIGAALMRDLFGLAQDRGWSRVYWHTRADNETGRRLYDRFAEADDFVRYRVIID